jgi:VanZ family protein
LDLILDFDKMIHGGMFGLLAFLFMYPFVKTNKSEKKKKQIFLWITLATSCWGYLTECIQWYVPGRSYDMVDWAADNIGIIFAFVIMRLYLQRFQPRH